MKRLFAISGLTLFTFISCNENQSGIKNAGVVATDNENKTETKNAKPETSDAFNSSNYSDPDNQTTYTKELDLFRVRNLEENANKKVGFISLSDIYPLSEHPDSMAIPNLENADKNSLQYFK